MEKIKKFVTQYQEQITAGVQLFLCVVFFIATAAGAIKKDNKKGKKK